ncbi:MAG: energy transducer TonB [Acetobacteraceae bacterium]
MNAETRLAIGRRAGAADLHARRLTGRKAGRGDGRLSRSALISVLLHGVVLAALVIFMQRRQPAEYVPPAPIAMVFEHGGAARTTAPPAARRGPPETAALSGRPSQNVPVRPLPGPPPAAPPVPPKPAPRPAPPGVAVHLPAEAQMQAFLEPPKIARPAPLPEVAPAPAPQPSATPAPQKLPPHTLFVPSLSFGATPKATPQAPGRGLNLALNQSELQRAFAPAFAVEGKIDPDWLSELSNWVDRRKYYPYSAAEMGQQGSVELRLVIERNGQVAGVRLLQSSGSPFLDQAWLGMFRGARVPAFPAGTKAEQIIIRATMHYILVD